MSSRIRLFHACPNHQYLDCYCNTRPICQNIGYCGCTEYCEIDYGSHSIIVSPPRNQSQHLIDAYTYLPDASCHTAIATGASDDMSLFVVPDANTPYSQGKAFLRFVNLAYDTPCLDFRFTDGAFVIANNIQYKEVTQYYPVTPSTYRMQAMICNTSQVVLTVPTITLQAGRSYTLYITGAVYQPPYCSHNITIDGIYPGANNYPSCGCSTTPSWPTTQPCYDYNCGNTSWQCNCYPIPAPCTPTCYPDYFPDHSCKPPYYPDYSCKPSYHPDCSCGSSCSHSSCGKPFWSSDDCLSYGSSYTHYYSDDCCTRNQEEKEEKEDIEQSL